MLHHNFSTNVKVVKQSKEHFHLSSHSFTEGNFQISNFLELKLQFHFSKDTKTKLKVHIYLTKETFNKIYSHFIQKFTVFKTII